MIVADFLALAPLFGGIAGLLQLSLLPGILVLQLLARRQLLVGAVSAPLLVFSCSLVLSFLAILVLHTVGLHTRAVWWVLGLLQCAGWLYLARTRPARAEPAAAPLPLPLLHALLALLFLLYCLLFATELAGQWPAVFEQWDTVINWNRWALDWTHGEWPLLTWGYPQLLPAAWSLVYLWQGSTETEFLLRAWLGLFPLGIALVCFDMFRRWRACAPLLAGMVLLLLLGSSWAQVLDSGYADVPVTFFTLLTGHWVMCALAEGDKGARWLYYAAMACAGAMLTKQGGLLAVPLLAWGLWCCRLQRTAVLQVVCLLLALVLPWYALQGINGTGGDVSGYVTEAIYGGETLPARLWRALGTTLPALLFPGRSAATAMVLLTLLVAALAVSLREARGRLCALAGLGWLLLWSLYFSYDGRNLLPGLPFLLLAAALGIEPLADFISARLPLVAPRRLPALRLPAPIVPVLVLVLLGAGLLPGNPARWETLTNELRKQSGDPALNRQLLDYVAAPGFAGTIYTTYPQLAAITELRPHLYADFGATHMQSQTISALLGGQPFCSILATFPRHTSISHLLLHVSVYPELVAAALAEGSLQLRLATAEQRLMQVHCPPPATTLQGASPQ